jgi:lipopolysaccharide heptosyltransferase II
MKIVNKITLLKLLDVWIGRMLIRCFPAARSSMTSVSLSRILIIRPGGIGDAVLLVPVILAIKEKYTDICIDVLAEKRNAAVYSLCPVETKVYSYDRWRELLHVLYAKYDAVIDSEQWYRLSALVAYLIRAPIKIGFQTNERSRLFNYRIPYRQSDYETKNFFRLVAMLDVAPPAQQQPPFLSAPDRAMHSAQGLIGEIRGEYAVVFPGASVPEKRWEGNNFACLITRLQAMGLRVIIIGGESDRAEVLPKAVLANFTDLIGKTTLEETAAIISLAKVFISGDSGVLHIAMGLGVPTVSLFGPSSTNKWAPRGERHIVINKNLHCSPCAKFGYTPKCSINARCMADITVAEVVAAVEKLLIGNSE